MKEFYPLAFTVDEHGLVTGGSYRFALKKVYLTTGIDELAIILP